MLDDAQDAVNAIRDDEDFYTAVRASRRATISARHGLPPTVLRDQAVNKSSSTRRAWTHAANLMIRFPSVTVFPDPDPLPTSDRAGGVGEPDASIAGSAWPVAATTRENDA